MFRRSVYEGRGEPRSNVQSASAASSSEPSQHRASSRAAPIRGEKLAGFRAKGVAAPAGVWATCSRRADSDYADGVIRRPLLRNATAADRRPNPVAGRLQIQASDRYRLRETPSLHRGARRPRGKPAWLVRWSRPKACDERTRPYAFPFSDCLALCAPGPSNGGYATRTSTDAGAP